MSDLQYSVAFNATEAKAEHDRLNKKIKEGEGYIGQMTLRLKLMQAQFKASTNPAEMERLGNSIKKTKTELDQLNSAAKSGGGFFGGMAGQMLKAGVGFASVYQGVSMLKQELKDTIAMATSYQNAFIGLTSVSQKFGQNSTQVNAALMDLTKDGLIPMNDAAVAMKNLFATGFSLEQTINLMRGFKDSASFNRQSALQFGEAVRSATEGIKNGNSILVDNAGITKNLSIILKEAGYSERDLMKVVSDVNVRLAMYNGLMKEAAVFTGDASLLTKVWAGQMAALDKAVMDAEASIGTRIQNAILNSNALKPIVQWLKEVAEEQNRINLGDIGKALTGTEVPSQFTGRLLEFYEQRRKQRNIEIKELEELRTKILEFFETEGVGEKTEKTRADYVEFETDRIALLKNVNGFEFIILDKIKEQNKEKQAGIKFGREDIDNRKDFLKWLKKEYELERLIEVQRIKDLSLIEQHGTFPGRGRRGATADVLGSMSADKARQRAMQIEDQLKSQKALDEEGEWGRENYHKKQIEEQKRVDKEIEDEHKRMTDRMNQRSDQFAQNFADAFGYNAIRGFKGVEQYFKQMMLRMGAQGLSNLFMSIVSPERFAIKSIFDLFAAGGAENIQGGTRGRDSISAMLTPGESVLTVGATRALQNTYGEGWITNLNKATSGGAKSTRQHYAGGVESIPSMMAQQPISMNITVISQIDKTEIGKAWYKTNGVLDTVNRLRGNPIT